MCSGGVPFVHTAGFLWNYVGAGSLDTFTPSLGWTSWVGPTYKSLWLSRTKIKREGREDILSGPSTMNHLLCTV